MICITLTAAKGLAYVKFFVRLRRTQNDICSRPSTGSGRAKNRAAHGDPVEPRTALISGEGFFSFSQLNPYSLATFPPAIFAFSSSVQSASRSSRNCWLLGQVDSAWG